MPLLCFSLLMVFLITQMLWRANTDLQLVANPYGTAQYILKYISKDEAQAMQIVKLWLQKLARLAEGQTTTVRAFIMLGNAMFATRIVPAQKAATILLGYELCHISRTQKSIRTRSPGEIPTVIIHEGSTPAQADASIGSLPHERVLRAYCRVPRSLFPEGLSLGDFLMKWDLEAKKPKTDKRTPIELEGLPSMFMLKREKNAIVSISPINAADPHDEAWAYQQCYVWLPWHNMDPNDPFPGRSGVEMLAKAREDGTLPQHLLQFLNFNIRSAQMASNIQFGRELQQDEEEQESQDALPSRVEVPEFSAEVRLVFFQPNIHSYTCFILF